MLRAAPLLRIYRRTNFISSFKDKLNQEIAKNKELQETLKGIREDKTLANASAAARQAAASVAGKVQQAGSAAADKASAAADKAAAAAKGAKEGEPQDAKAETGAKADATGEQTSDGSPKLPPLHQRLMEDVGSIIGNVRERLSQGIGGGAKPAEGGEGGGNAVVVRPPSFWEKTFSFGDNSFFRGFSRFFGVAGDAAGGFGDRVLGETEQAEAVRELKEIVPDFSIDDFLNNDVKIIVPQVLNAYLKGNVDELRRTCRDAAFGMLHRSVLDREAASLQIDPRLLHVSDPDIETIRFVGGQPTAVVSFESHQLHCVRNKATAAIVEGGEDEIRAVHYLFALQLNEDAEAPRHERWKVTELAIRTIQPVY